MKERDDGRSTRALAIHTTMSYMSYMSSKHFSFAFRKPPVPQLTLHM